MRKSSHAQLSYQPRPRAIVECGSGSDPNHGCTDERGDAIAAYTHALMWSINQDWRHAEKAIEIMDAWSDVIRSHTGSNARLQSGWSGVMWSRAGEIIRHTGGGWEPEHVNRFATMLRTVYLPMVTAAAGGTNGNWDLIMTDAAVGISVFLDDQASFQRAVDRWRTRVAAHIYLASDGPTPNPPPGTTVDTRAELVKYWQGQDRFVDGLTQETCRSFGYAGWGLAASAHIAETARHQGLDLYGEMRERMTNALELHATYQLGAPVPSWLCGGSVSLGLGPTLEVAYNHYASRLGITLPKTTQLIESHLRPAGASFFIAWETLTHAGSG